MKSRLSGFIIRMWFARDSAAHLAGKAIPIQNIGSGFLGNGAFKCGFWFGRQEQVLTGLEVASVVMCKDLITLFGAQLTHAPRPFGYTARNGPEFIRIQDASEILDEMAPQAGPCPSCRVLNHQLP